MDNAQRVKIAVFKSQALLLRAGHSLRVYSPRLARSAGVELEREDAQEKGGPSCENSAA